MRKITVKGREIILDSDTLSFDESTLQKYIEKEGSWYSYYGEALADAEAEWKDAENKYEISFQKTFQNAKAQEGKTSDKCAEAIAKIDIAVMAAKEMELETRHKVRLLQQHLKSYDKNHDNAQSRGHFLRKEMDKLAGFHSEDDSFTSEVDKIVRSADEQLADNALRD